MQDFNQQIKKALEQIVNVKSTFNRKWIDINPVSVYVRKGVRFFNDKKFNTIEIANIDVEESERKKGYFRTICNIAEEIAREKNLCVYHENVIEDLHAFHTQRGYQKIGEHFNISFYKNFNGKD